jgi:hypothetical protein
VPDPAFRTHSSCVNTSHSSKVLLCFCLQGDQSCYFRDEVERLQQLDLSIPFSKLAKELKPFCASLAALLHHKNEVVSRVVRSLREDQAICWKSLLALMSVLAKDLRSDLVPFMAEFNLALKAMIDPAKPEKTAEVFRALSLVFRFVGPALADSKSAFDSTLTAWAEYFGSKRPLLRQMACSSLAVLTKRLAIKDQSKTLKRIWKGVAVCSADQLPAPEDRDSAAMLAFENIKGPSGGLHSRGIKLLGLLLSFCTDVDGDGAVEAAARRFDLFSHLFRYLLKHCGDDAINTCWDVIVDVATSQMGGVVDGLAAISITVLLSLLVSTLRVHSQTLQDTARAAKVAKLLLTVFSPEFYSNAAVPALGKFHALQLLRFCWARLDDPIVTAGLGKELTNKDRSIHAVMLQRAFADARPDSRTAELGAEGVASLDPVAEAFMCASTDTICGWLPGPALEAMTNHCDRFIRAGTQQEQAPLYCASKTIDDLAADFLLHVLSDLSKTCLTNSSFDRRQVAQSIKVVVTAARSYLFRSVSDSQSVLPARSVALILALRDAISGLCENSLTEGSVHRRPFATLHRLHGEMPDLMTTAGRLNLLPEHVGRAGAATSVSKQLAASLVAVVEAACTAYAADSIEAGDIARSAFTHVTALTSLQVAQADIRIALIKAVERCDAALTTSLQHAATTAGSSSNLQDTLDQLAPLYHLYASLLRGFALVLDDSIDVDSDKSLSKSVENFASGVLRQVAVVGEHERASMRADSRARSIAYNSKGDSAAVATLHSAATVLEAVGRHLVLADMEECAELQKSAFATLSPLACSKLHAVRLSVLRILSCFPALHYNDASHAKALPQLELPTHVDVDRNQSGECKVVDLCLQVESLPNTLTFERTKVSHLIKLGVMVTTGHIPALYVPLLINVLFGQLYVRFSALWKHASNSLLQAAAIYPNTTWEAFALQIYLASCARTSVVGDDDGTGNGQDNDRLTQGSMFSAVGSVQSRLSRFSSATSMASSWHSQVTEAVNAPTRSRSKARSDILYAPLLPLKIATEAIKCHLTGEVLEDIDMLDEAGSKASRKQDTKKLLSQTLEFPVLAARSNDVLLAGLVGADAVQPRVVENLILEYESAFHSDAKSSALSHANDYVQMNTQAGGIIDSEIYHATVFTVLADAVDIAESKSRVLVPLFLAFLRDDYFPSSHLAEAVADPDAVELNLPATVQRIWQKHSKQRDHKASKGRSPAGASSSTSTEQLLESLVPQRSVGAEASQIKTLPRSAANGRVLNFLTVFEKFRSWGGVFASDEFLRVVTHLLSKTGPGLAMAALKVIAAMRLPYIEPYKNNLFRLAKDETYRDEMVVFQLAPTSPSCSIAADHRPHLIPLICRLLYGRLLQRKGQGKGSRDTPQTRRAAVMSCLSGLTVSEVPLLLSIILRPFFLGTDPAFAESFSAEKMLSQFARPRSAADAAKLLNRLVGSLAPPTKTGSAAPSALLGASSSGEDKPIGGLVTAARAAGFLHLLHDIVRQFGLKVTPFMHLIWGCLTLVLTYSKKPEHKRKDESGADSDNELSDDEDNEEGDDGYKYDIQGKGKALRALVLQGISDAMQDLPVESMHAWMPLWSSALSKSIQELPVVMMYSSKPSALLTFFVTMSRLPNLRQYLASMPGVLPAVMSALSIGSSSCSAVYQEHLRIASQHSKDAKAPALIADEATVSDMSTKVVPESVLSDVFEIVEQLLAACETSDDLSKAMRVHVPFLIQHIAARMQSHTTATSVVVETGHAHGDLAVTAEFEQYAAPEQQRRKLLQGRKAFAVRQMKLVGALSSIIVKQHAFFAATFGADHVARVVDQVCDVLIAFCFAKKSVDDTNEETGRPFILRLLRQMVQFTSQPDRLVPTLVSLLTVESRDGTSDDHRIRALVAETISSLMGAKQDDSKPAKPITTIDRMAKALQQITQMDAKQVDTLDFDAVVEGISDLKSMNILVPAAHAVSLGSSVLHQAFCLLRCADIAARSAAQNFISTVLGQCAAATKTWWAIRQGGAPLRDLTMPALIRGDTRSYVQALFYTQRILLPSITAAVSSRSSNIRKAGLSFAAELSSAFLFLSESTAAAHLQQMFLADIQVLINRSDLESDDILNLTHQQMHRRTRAFGRLAHSIEANKFTETTLTQLLLPFIQQTLFDELGLNRAFALTGKRAQNKRAEPIKLNSDAQGLINEAIKALGAVSKVSVFATAFKTILSIFTAARQVARDHPEDSHKSLLRSLFRAALGMIEQLPVPNWTTADSDKYDGPELHNISQLLIQAADSIGAGKSQARDKLSTLMNAEVTDAAAADATDVDVDADDDVDMPDQTAVVPTVDSTEATSSLLYKIAGTLLPKLWQSLFDEVEDDDRGKKTSIRHVRLPVALCIVHVLKKLPPAVMQRYVPRLVLEIAAGLKSRMQDIRDDARNTLARVTSLLGVSHLETVLRHVKFNLTEGYMMHIMGHTLNTVIASVADTVIPVAPAWQTEDGKLRADETELSENCAAFVSALPLVVEMIVHDIFGEAAEARKAESGYRPKTALKEARFCKSYETLEMVCKIVPFYPHTCIHTITAAVLASAETYSHRPEVKTDIMPAMFRSCLSGLLRNASVTPLYLLVYVYGVCKDFLPRDISAKLDGAGKEKDYAKSAAASKAKDGDSLLAKWSKKVHKRPAVSNWLITDAGAATARRGSSSAGDSALSPALEAQAAARTKFIVQPEPKMTGTGRYLATEKQRVNSGLASFGDTAMVAFALSLLRTCLSKGKLSPIEGETASMLDPFVALLTRLLQQNFDAHLTALAIRILTILGPHNLPLYEQYSKAIARSAFQLFESEVGGAGMSSSSRSDLAHSALKFIAAMLRQKNTVEITVSQQAALVQLIRLDINNEDRQNACFGLLRALLGRRCMLPELYDLMDELAKLLVRSLRPAAREQCASVLLHFLLKYPMSEKKLHGFLEFFMRNLEYDIEAGRMAVIDMLTAIVQRFPQAALDGYASFIMLPVTARLANDTSDRCKAGYATLLQKLITAVSAQTAKALVDIGFQWIAPTQATGLRRAGYGVLTLFATAKLEAVLHKMPALVAALAEELCIQFQIVSRVQQSLQNTSNGAIVMSGGAVGIQTLMQRGNVHFSKLADDEAGLSNHGGDSDDDDVDTPKQTAEDSDDDAVLQNARAGVVGEAKRVSNTAADNSAKAASGPRIDVPWQLVSAAIEFMQTLLHKCKDGNHLDVLFGAVPSYSAASKKSKLNVAAAGSAAEVASVGMMGQARALHDPFVAVLDFLLYPHTSVRGEAAKVLVAVFDARTASPKVAGLMHWLQTDGRMLRVAHRLCSQLSTEELQSDAPGLEITSRCLLLTLAELTTTEEVSSAATVCDDVNDDDDDDHSDDASEEGGDAPASDSHRYSAIAALRRISALARLRGGLVAAAVIKVFAGLAAESQTIPELWLRSIIRVLFHFTTPGQFEESERDAEAVTLAQQCLEFYQSKFGVERIVGMLGDERKRVLDSRIQRKQERSTLMMLDPAKAFERKMKKQAAKKRYHQTKTDGYRMLRGAVMHNKSSGAKHDHSANAAAAMSGAKRKQRS